MRRLQIGVAKPNHAAFRVRRGQMKNALDFFQEVLGWDVSDRIVSGEWGEARFVLPSRGADFSVQLTDYFDHADRAVTYSGTHLGLTVNNAIMTAAKILEWAKEQNISCRVEPANEEKSKWFVGLPDWFTFEFEFITA